MIGLLIAIAEMIVGWSLSSVWIEAVGDAVGDEVGS